MANDPTIEPRAVVEPRLAATVLLLRDGEDGMEVFMVVRHHQIDFASGALVFPGGSIDPGDREIAANPALFPPQPGLSAADAALRAPPAGGGELFHPREQSQIRESWRKIMRWSRDFKVSLPLSPLLP